jgi:hypothetical protein
MPTYGITEQMVRDAVKQLEQEGRRVSLKTLRAQLGRGSNTTLLRYLDRIAPRIDGRRRTPPPAPSVQAEVDALLRRVWAAAYEHASKSEAAGYASKMAALEAQRVKLAAQLAALRNESERMHARVARAEEKVRWLARRLQPCLRGDRAAGESTPAVKLPPGDDEEFRVE